jgi:hypothetical protein
MEADQPIAALLTDLKRLGMLEETLVIWGGEFGRTPTVELPTPAATPVRSTDATITATASRCGWPAAA